MRSEEPRYERSKNSCNSYVYGALGCGDKSPRSKIDGDESDDHNGGSEGVAMNLNPAGCDPIVVTIEVDIAVVFQT